MNPGEMNHSKERQPNSTESWNKQNILNVEIPLQFLFLWTPINVISTQELFLATSKQLEIFTEHKLKQEHKNKYNYVKEPSHCH